MPLSTYTTMLLVQFILTAAQENGSEQQLESGKDVFFHPPLSTFFSKGLCLMFWKNMTERLTKAEEPIPICGFPMTLMLLLKEEQELQPLVESLDKACTRYEDKR